MAEVCFAGRSCHSISLIYGLLCALSTRSEKHQWRKWSFAASAFQISKFIKADVQARCRGNKYENLRHSRRKKVILYARVGVFPLRLRLGLAYFLNVPDFFGQILSTLQEIFDMVLRFDLVICGRIKNADLSAKRSEGSQSLPPNCFYGWRAETVTNEVTGSLA